MLIGIAKDKFNKLLLHSKENAVLPLSIIVVLKSGALICVTTANGTKWQL